MENGLPHCKREENRLCEGPRGYDRDDFFRGVKFTREQSAATSVGSS